MAVFSLRSVGRIVGNVGKLAAVPKSSTRSLSHFPIDDKIFGLSEDHQQLRETIFNFAQKELAPHAHTIDKENNFAELRHFWRKLVRPASVSRSFGLLCFWAVDLRI